MEITEDNFPLYREVLEKGGNDHEASVLSFHFKRAAAGKSELQYNFAIAMHRAMIGYNEVDLLENNDIGTLVALDITRRSCFKIFEEVARVGPAPIANRAREKSLYFQKRYGYKP